VSDGTTAGTGLVVEVAPGSADGLPFSFSALAVGPLLYFEAQEVAHGLELWVSDGTAAGTRLVKDINPGPATGNPYVLGALDETLYLTVDDGVHGYELWRSDGSAEGTALVADIASGPESSYPAEITALGDNVYMMADDGVHGQQLWRSSGVPGEAAMVAQLGDGPEGLANWPELAVAAGRLYLVEHRSGTRIWASDGSTAGTGLVRAFGAGAVTIGQVGALALIGFDGDTASLDSGLWTSDGTPAGTAQIVAHMAPGEFRAFGDLILMSARSAQYGAEPWVSDGTAAGTRLLKDINQAPADGEIACLTRHGERLYFSANDGVHGAELWVSGGTPASTFMLADLVPGPSGSSPCGFVPFAGALTFVAEGMLWRSDGTAAGTTPIISSAHPDGLAARSGLTVAGGLGFFSAGPINDELWALEGDLQTARLLRDFELFGRYGVVPLAPRYAVSGRLVFGLSGLYGNASVWSSDGTPEGTQLIEGGTLVGVADGRALYLAHTYEPNSGSLMGTDGTLAGTAPILPDLITPPWYEQPISASADGRAFFTAPGGLMVSDGTAAGTQTLTELHWHISTMATAGGRLFFVQEEANPELLQAELWASDGTAAGTRLLRSFAGPRKLRVDNLTLADGVLYFAAGDPAQGRELWTSDGTAGGTLRCLDLNPGPASSSPLGEGQAALLGGRLIFAADDGAHGRELWSVVAGGCALKAYLPLAAR
jgi:ELWxxDGT repeat protein